MKNRAIICVIVFLLLTAVKLLLPNTAAEVRACVLPAISSEADIRDDVIALGRVLAGYGNYIYTSEHKDDGSASDSSPSPTLETSPSPTGNGSDLSKMDKESTSGIGTGKGDSSPKNETSSAAPSAVVSPTPSKTPSPVPTTSKAQIATPSAVSALSEKVGKFKREQAVFSDYAIPASVCLDTLTLPFKTSVPSTGAISSVFGYRDHPVYGDVRFHYGTDFAASDGDAVTAFADGKVTAVQEIEGYGQTVSIDHGSGYTTLYAHLEKVLVNTGDKVKRGSKIALVGHSGLVTGPNLHFELKHNGKYLNPEFYI